MEKSLTVELILVALSWGFSGVLWLGAASYAGALLAFWGRSA